MTDLKLTDIEWLENLIGLFKDRMNEYTLQHFQQIKTELEAWEVIKDKNVDIWTIRMTENYDHFLFEYHYEEDEYLTRKEYELIKKALEVKENGK